MAKGQFVTAEHLEKLREELKHLISVERPACSKAIAEAREKGDLSENAEYDAAREAQGLLELKISKLQDLIANAQIIDESKISTDKVGMLSKVTLKNLNNNATMVYTIVGESEANLAEGKLASSTPIGKAILGHKKGEIVEVNAPAGVMKFKIEDIGI